MRKPTPKLTEQQAQLQLRLAQLQAESERFELRYQNLVAQFYQAQAAYHKSMAECAHRRAVIAAKQEVIDLLLPYYPHPLTPALQAKIDLT